MRALPLLLLALMGCGGSSPDGKGNASEETDEDPTSDPSDTDTNTDDTEPTPATAPTEIRDLPRFLFAEFERPAEREAAAVNLAAWLEVNANPNDYGFEIERLTASDVGSFPLGDADPANLLSVGLTCTGEAGLDDLAAAMIEADQTWRNTSYEEFDVTTSGDEQAFSERSDSIVLEKDVVYQALGVSVDYSLETHLHWESTEFGDVLVERTHLTANDCPEPSCAIQSYSVALWMEAPGGHYSFRANWFENDYAAPIDDDLKRLGARQGIFDGCAALDARSR